MLIESVRLGQLEVSADNLITFPQGLPGFLQETTFAFIPHGAESPFAFLQSITEPNLTFLIADAFAFFSNYQFELGDEYVKELEIADDTPLKIYSIVTVPEKVEEMTANLLAPVIINLTKRLGRQIILGNTAFTTKHRLFPQGFPQNNAKGGK